MHLATSVSALLPEAQPVREIVLTEFQYKSGDSGLWPALAEQVGELVAPGDILVVDSMGLCLAALLPQEIRDRISVISRRPPIVGSARMDPEGAVQRIYSSWLRKLAAGQADSVVQAILPENSDYPGGFGIAPEPQVLAQIVSDFGASNVEVGFLGAPPENWLILEGGQDKSFHPEEALRTWQSWGMPVFSDLPSAVVALNLN